MYPLTCALWNSILTEQDRLEHLAKDTRAYRFSKLNANSHYNEHYQSGSPPVLSSALVGQTSAGLSKCYLNGTSSGNVCYMKQFPGRLMQILR